MFNFALMNLTTKQIAEEINGTVEFDGEYPYLNDGLRGMMFIEKAVESHKKGNIWVKLN